MYWIFVQCLQIESKLRGAGLYRGRKSREPEKNPRSKEENQQQPQTRQDAGSRIRTQATVVGGERRLHCIISALHCLILFVCCLFNCLFVCLFSNVKASTCCRIKCWGFPSCCRYKSNVPHLLRFLHWKEQRKQLRANTPPNSDLFK